MYISKIVFSNEVSMPKSSSIQKLFSMTILIFLASCPFLSGEWTESNHFGIGSSSFKYQSNYYLRVPESQYVVLYSGNDIIALDITGARIRGCLTMTHEF